MKLTTLFFLIASSFLAVSAFGVNPASHTSVGKNRLIQPSGTTTPTTSTTTSLSFQKKSATAATTSALFRDPIKTRGGAVPGWAAYNDALDKKPLLTKAMTSLVGWAAGDFLAQIFISGGPFDLKRFLTLSAFGFLYHGPSGHYFYNWLDQQIEGTDAKHVAMKVAFDQLIWCPIFMTVFFTYLGLVNGDGLGVIVDKVKSDLLTACQGSWKVWPIVHAVNFKFISTKHRLVFINGVQIAFNMFLSLIGTKK